jgi:hypothetical protein
MVPRRHMRCVRARVGSLAVKAKRRERDRLESSTVQECWRVVSSHELVSRDP